MKVALVIFTVLSAPAVLARQYQCAPLGSRILIEVDLDLQTAAFYDGTSLTRAPEIGFPQGTFHWFQGLATYGEMYEVKLEEKTPETSIFAVTRQHKTTEFPLRCERVPREHLELF